jgi:glycosyltransferase involved in cell wall biosynthesis
VSTASGENSSPLSLPPAPKPVPGKTIVVLPAYNAARTVEATIRDIPAGYVDEMILVDDCSRDDTVRVARELGLTVIVHPENRDYGANQKTYYTEALKRGADYVIMVHPDYQYDGRMLPHFLGVMQLGICDVVVGSRIRCRAEALEGGMPRYKYLVNRVLTFIENVALGQNLGDFHSGYRGYTRKVLETIPFMNNSDGFVFDTEFLVQAVHFGFRIGDVPVPVRYFDEASSIRFWPSCRYGTLTLWTVCKYWLRRLGIHDSPLFQPSLRD